MPRRKIQMGLIGKAGSRTRTFKQRKAGLQKKASELAELCDVEVAVVVGAVPGGGAPEVWEFGSAGVVDRYRRLPADRRAKHTHLGYLSAELGKEKAKLARERKEGPKALAPPAQNSLDGVDLEELLGSIDAALLATAQRRKALGMPEDDDGGQLQQAAPDALAPLVGDGFDDDMEAWVDELTWQGVVETPHPLNARMMQVQQPAAPGVQYINGVEPPPLNAGMMQQPASGVQYINGGCLDMGGNQQYLQQMGSNGENDHGQLRNTLTCPDYGFQYTDSNNYSYSDMNGCLQMPMPSYGNAYDGCWFNQAMNPSLDITCNPVHMPPEYSSMATMGDCFTGVSAMNPSLDTTCNPVHMPPAYSSAATTGDCFTGVSAMNPSMDITCNPVHMPPEYSSMATTGDCFTGLSAMNPSLDITCNPVHMPPEYSGTATTGDCFTGVSAMNPSLDITCNPVHMPPEYSSMATTGDCFTGVSAIGLDDGSFTDAGGYEYGTQCLADYFQCPDANQQLGVEPLHYFSDVAEGICYYDLDESGSCSSGRSQLFAQSYSSSGTLQFCSEQSQQSDVRGQASGVQEFWVR